MDISLRTQQLNKLFSVDKKVKLEESNLEIIPFRFTQREKTEEIDAFQRELSTVDFCPVSDEHINENKSFYYSVFFPSGKLKQDKAIVLLHGLNERTWEKYLIWAEYLAEKTGKPVILFPIAFHMNRTPLSWILPREISPWVNRRKEEIQDITNSTFINVALSSRISKHPLRFYASGRESVFNLCQLISEIKAGKHELFKKDTSINIFSYSIGSLLSQVLLLANPRELFSDTRLFMFCGGSIFNHMNGNARDILDKEAYDRLQTYFTTDFIVRGGIPTSFKNDTLESAFKAMIRPDVMKNFRESFFQQACNRIHAISLKKDIVMPTKGIIKALGKVSGKILEELDFPFPYSHQKPFLMHSRTEPQLINESFKLVFDKASSFL